MTPGSHVRVAVTALLVLLGRRSAAAPAQTEPKPVAADESRLRTARMLVNYFEEMSVPKPFLIREGQAFKAHQVERRRRRLLECIELWPLPERVPQDVHRTEPLVHPWGMVQRVYYQLWPGVYASGLLYLPKEMPE